MSAYEITWNSDEIFEMAEQIEVEGAKFYRKAAGASSDQELKALLLELAAQEDQHRQTFSKIRAEMKTELKFDESWDPEGIVRTYLQGWVSGQVFDVKIKPEELLSTNNTPQKVLQLAIGLEKDSIAFYVGIVQMVPEELGKGWVERIIQEEMKHIIVLTKEMRRFK